MTLLELKNVIKIRQKNGELFEAVYRGEKDFSELKNIVWLFGEEIEKQKGKSKNRNIKKSGRKGE